MRVRLGVRRTDSLKPAGVAPYAHEYGAVEGPPIWVELNGNRIPPEAGLLSVSHEQTADSFGVVTLKYICTGYETVDAEASDG